MIPLNSDLFKFIDLYRQFGIDIKTNKTTEGYSIILGDNFFGGNIKEVTMSIKFEGYSGFFTSIDFDENGKFIKQGFWE